MINYWIRYGVYALLLTFGGIFWHINALVVMATLFLIAEMNYLFSALNQRREK